MSDCVDITILGGGPVGLFAAFYAGMRGMSVRIIDSLSELGGQLTALYPEKYVFDMPGFPKVLAKDLASALIAQGTQFGPDICLEETASELERKGDFWEVRTSAGNAYPTKTLIIAAGAGAFQPTKIGLENEDSWVGKGLLYGVRDRNLLTGRRVAIVGGGDSAFDWVLNLHEVAESVCLIHRRDVFRAHEETIRQVEELGIPKHLFREVVELHGGDQLNAISMKNSQTGDIEHLDCDYVIVNIGYKSSLGPILNWGLEIEKNQVKVNRLFETCLPGVFAVGDVATFEGKIKLIATGVGEACTAVCIAKTRLDPNAKLFPGHSSNMDLTGATK